MALESLDFMFLKILSSFSQEELDRLNQASDEINRLENELDVSIYKCKIANIFLSPRFFGLDLF